MDNTGNAPSKCSFCSRTQKCSAICVGPGVAGFSFTCPKSNESRCPCSRKAVSDKEALYLHMRFMYAPLLLNKLCMLLNKYLGGDCYSAHNRHNRQDKAKVQVLTIFEAGSSAKARGAHSLTAAKILIPA